MSFHPKSFDEAKANHKPMSRKKPISRGKGFKPYSPCETVSEKQGNGSNSRNGQARGHVTRQRKPINRVGPRTREWQSAWRFLKPRLEATDRISCEFDFVEHECWGRLDPAHSKKRSKMIGNDIYAVAIACQNVHTYLDEACTHERMEMLVLEAINRHGGLILP